MTTPSDFVRLALDPLRLAILGAAASGPVDAAEVAERMGTHTKDALIGLNRLREAGLLSDDNSLNREALRELAIALPTETAADPAVVDGPWSAGEVEVLRRFFQGSKLKSIPTNRAKRLTVLERLAMEFFAAHRLYRSHRSDHVPDERMKRMPFPPRWHHDVLRGLDWLRAAEAPRDERLQDPIDVVLGHRRRDGRWPIHANYSGDVWFRMESGRVPSRWNTMRALRVLAWCHGSND